MKTHYHIGLFIAAIICAITAFVMVSDIDRKTFYKTKTTRQSPPKLEKLTSRTITANQSNTLSKLIIEDFNDFNYDVDLTIIFTETEEIKLIKKDTSSYETINVNNIGFNINDDTLNIDLTPAMMINTYYNSDLTLILPAKAWQINLPKLKSGNISLEAKQKPSQLTVYSNGVDLKGQFGHISIWQPKTKCHHCRRSRIIDADIDLLHFYGKKIDLAIEEDVTAKQIYLHTQKNSTLDIDNLALMNHIHWQPLTSEEEKTISKDRKF